MAAAKESRIEVKVGALIVVCLLLLVAFLLLLSDLHFGESAEVTADWHASGGLKEGAVVKVAGILAGRVEEVEYQGGRFDEGLGRQVYVRVRMSLKPELRNTLRSDARFFITTVGLLGEKYVEVDPGRAAEPLGADAIVVGVEPMRIEVMAENVNMVLMRTARILEKNEAALTQTIENISAAAKTGRETLEEGRALVKETRAAITDARAQLVRVSNRGVAFMDTTQRALDEYTPGKGQTGDHLQALAARSAEVAGAVSRAVGDGEALAGTLRDTRALTNKARAVIQKVGDRAIRFAGKAEGLIEIADAVVKAGKAPVLSAISDTRDLLAVVRRLAQRIADGQGSVGALLNDREMFDDARELMKDLKRHPWKFLWKE